MRCTTNGSGQVNGGKAHVSHVRDFCHVVAREKATLSFFLCLGEVTKPMQQEAVKEGFWSSVVAGKDYPKVQILTIAGLLSGQEHPKMPPQDKQSLLGYRAQQQEKAGQQMGLALSDEEV